MTIAAISDEVCIVSCGCVLPDASNPEEFWSNVTENRCSMAPLPESRWEKRLFYSEDRNDSDATFSHYGASISDRILDEIRKRFSHVMSPTRLQLFTLEAVAQALKPVKFDGNRTSLFLGCMSCDEKAGLIVFFKNDLERLKQHMTADDFRQLREYFQLDHLDDEYCRNAVVNSSILHMIEKEFGINGFSALIDGACASSLLSVGLAVDALKSGETDCAVAGAIDANLSPETFVVFCRAGVMAEKSSIPFSTSSEGLLQGEGAVVFVMKRLSDAVTAGDTIHAVVKGVGICSSGRGSSLFQPSITEQIAAYRRAYQGGPVPELDFIEAHGTGTYYGDDAELRSIQQFFSGQRIALSSVKSMIGHTKAAAGAAGLLKSVLMMRHRQIPPFILSDGSRVSSSMPVYLPRKAVELQQETIRGGVSAFGFGGINTHLYLTSSAEQEYGKDSEERADSKSQSNDDTTILLVGKAGIAMDELPVLEQNFDLRIPGKSCRQIDPLQRMAVIAVSRAFQEAGIDTDALDRERVGVMSGCASGQEVARNLAYRMNYAQINAPFPENRYGRELIAALRDAYPPVTEDTGPGMLNNVIAGRVAHYFDFRGISCNVDYDEASSMAALALAKTYLSVHGGMIVVIGSNDLFDMKLLKFSPGRVDVYLVSTLSFARQHRLPVISVLREVTFSD
ncbi:MAG: beta-ketoacyl synthase N-terminal-like domain-containing protein [Candidatus Xenobiia bacterium LiM19]